VIIGWIDLRASEVQPVVLLILGSTALFGFVQPQRAWLSAALIGDSIFIAHLIGPLVTIRLRSQAECIGNAYGANTGVYRRVYWRFHWLERAKTTL